MAQYAIEIRPDVMDLVAHLNGGVRPTFEEWKTSFLLIDTEDPNHSRVVSNDDIYRNMDRRFINVDLFKIKPGSM